MSKFEDEFIKSQKVIKKANPGLTNGGVERMPSPRPRPNPGLMVDPRKPLPVRDKPGIPNGPTVGKVYKTY
jgi:hypothetical protein